MVALSVNTLLAFSFVAWFLHFLKNDKSDPVRGVSPQCNQFRHPSYLKYHKKTEQRLGTFAKNFSIFFIFWTALANIREPVKNYLKT